MPKISQLKQLRWDRVFKNEGVAPLWPEELTKAFWDKRGLIARKEKTNLGKTLEKHEKYFKKNPPPDLWGRNWSEVDNSAKQVQAWTKNHGKTIYAGFKDIRDTAKAAEKTFGKSKVIPKSDTKRAKEIADAADKAMISWNKNSLGGYLDTVYTELRAQIRKDQVRLMSGILKSTPLVPNGVEKRLKEARRQLKGWELLDEDQQESVRSDVGNAMQSAARNMTQSATNFIKCADMGIELVGYDETVLKKWNKKATKLGNNPGASSMASGADGPGLTKIVDDIEKLLDIFKVKVVPLTLAPVCSGGGAGGPRARAPASRPDADPSLPGDAGHVSAPSSPRSAMPTWVRWLAAAAILLGGLAGIAVDHAPPGTWALPVAAGPLADGVTVWEVRRQPHEARLAVGEGEARHAVRLLAADDPDAVDVVGRYALAADTAPPALHEAVRGAVARAEARWLRPPVGLRTPGVRVTAWQEAEEATLQLVLVGWLAALVAWAGAWWPQVRPRSARVGAGLALVALLPPVGVWLRGTWGPWHANLHGFDRLAAVAHGTPPAAAGLGLLHGHGWYVVVQGLDAVLGRWLDPFALTTLLTSLLLLAVWAWVRVLWEDEVAGLVAAAWMGLLPVTLRLAGSVSMYVPATLLVVCALLFFELHLRSDRGATLLLALPPAVLAVQTRAELAVVLPAWVVLSMLLRRPAWLATAWRRPVVWAGLAGAALACVPRAVSLVRSPPPGDLRRWATDPFVDPRVTVLAVLALLAVAVLLRPPRVRAGLAGAAVLGGVVLGGVALWGDTVLERTWQVHVVFDPQRTSPVLALLPVAGALLGVAQTPRRVGWLLLAWVVAVWLVVAQYDSLSTYVRTGLLTTPLLAALAGRAVCGARLPALPAVAVGLAMGVNALLGSLPWGAWVSTRFPTQQTWDAVVALREVVAPGDVVVWPAPDDLPPTLRAEGFHTERLALRGLLPAGVRGVGLAAWEAGEVPEGTRTWLLVTPDCWRPVLHPRSGRAWTPGGEVGWTYVDVPDVVSTPRVRFDLPEGYADRACRRARAMATEVLREPLSDEVSGSIYETSVPPADDPGWVGIARLPARPASR